MTRTAIKFGLFVALCMVFLVYLASTIGNTTALGLVGQGPETYKLSASFDDVSGLLVGDNVKVAGVPVGKVTGIALISEHCRPRLIFGETQDAGLVQANPAGQVCPMRELRIQLARHFSQQLVLLVLGGTAFT